MGFHRKGNQITAAIGREIQLIEAFVEEGYVVEVYDEITGNHTQYPSDSPYLDNYDESDQRKVTDRSELELERVDFDRQVERLGLDAN